MINYGTLGFDNTRFFAPKSEGGRESRWDGWVRVTIKGRREYLPGIDPQRSALVIIDLQRECCQEWPAIIARHDPKLAEIFARRANEIVIPNVVRLLKLFREKDMPVIYLTLDQDGIVPQIAPDPARLGDGTWWNRAAREFILTKYSSGAFATSALDNVLRELGIATLFCVGTDTSCCVEATMSGAYDRAYQTIMVEDACVASRPELHEAAVRIWAYKGFVRTTDQVVSDFPWQNWIDPGLT
jgi:biuret amidohydrolase